MAAWTLRSWQHGIGLLSCCHHSVCLLSGLTGSVQGVCAASDPLHRIFLLSTCETLSVSSVFGANAQLASHVLCDENQTHQHQHGGGESISWGELGVMNNGCKSLLETEPVFFCPARLIDWLLLPSSGQLGSCILVWFSVVLPLSSQAVWFNQKIKDTFRGRIKVFYHLRCI